jgi:trimeric autotransporter adhesin
MGLAQGSQLALSSPHRPHFITSFSLMCRCPQWAKKRHTRGIRIWYVLLVFCVSLFSLFADAAYSQVQYAYDAAGRLVQVVQANGSSAVYQYDAGGNILSIQTIPAGQLALVNLSSVDGGSGSQLTINGSGFSTTCSADAVAFNGTAATVVSCTANQLVVQVPSGVTSGPISVTVAGNLVTSTQSFTALPSPSISGFTPALANVGGTVTVSGTNLDPLVGGTSVSVNGFYVQTASISPTQLTFAAPQETGTITVTTPNGVANSATPLLVLSSSIPVSGILSSATLIENGAPQSLSVNQSSAYGLFNFNATQGQFLSLQVSSLVTSPSGAAISYQVFSPTLQQIYTGSISSTNLSIHLPPIPATGTYIVEFASGSATVQLTAALQVDPTLSLAGTPLAESTSVAWQSQRSVILGTAGQNDGLAITSLALTPSSAGTTAWPYIYAPNGAILADPNCYVGTSCSIPLRNLTQTGSYTLVVDPAAAQSMSFNVVASQAVTATLTAGTAQSLSLSVPGQYGVVSFSNSAVQTVTLNFDSVTTSPANQSISVTVYNSSGSSVGGMSGAIGGTLTLTNLAAGNYTIVVLPANAATANLQLYLGSSTTLTTSGTGSSASASTSTPGESVTYTFSATAGQNLGLAITGLTLTPSSAGTTAWPYVYAPNGAIVVDPVCYVGTSCSMPLRNLTQTGTYTLVMSAASTDQQTMNFNVQLSQAATATLTAGTAQSLSLSVPGQYAVVSYTNSATQTVTLNFDSVTTTPANQSISVTVYNSSGSSVGGTSGTVGGTLTLTNLAAGNYTIVVLPANAATANLQLYVGTDTALTTSGTGSSASASTSTPGESVTYTFPGTAGQNLGVGITGLTLTPSSAGTTAWPYIYAPNGAILADPVCYAGTGCSMPLRNLTQTGNYTLVMSAASTDQQTMNFNVQISQAATGTLTTGTQNLSISMPGQYAVLSLTNSATQTVSFSYGSISTTPANQSIGVTVYNSSGGVVSGGSSSSTTGGTLTLTNLAAGNYTIVVLPANAATATLQVTH